MPRLRDTRTGVVVNVSDDTAARLPAAYEAVSGKSEKAPVKKAASGKSSKSEK